MKRKSAALILPLFFASSILAVSSFKDDSSLFSGSGNFLADSDISSDADMAANDTDSEEIASSEQYTTDSDVLIYESKEDKRKLKQQKRELDAELKAKLTKQLNEEALLALEKQLAEKGRPVTAQDKAQVEVVQAEQQPELKQADVIDTLEPENADQELAMLNTAQQLENQRRALNLAPPIPPGTLGGGNGNGGPGAGQFTASSN
ncbi:hypothetical protein [Thalassotalea crassostreae]|uniref:hypothetical protein n=1 Tax=Thalassotalea crassostreae TaxID=1763536 RepID=UPI000837BF7D|nr:hypothetical protein [Thalassotalea crassostreae]